MPGHRKNFGNNIFVTEITVELNQDERNHLRNCKKRIESKSCEVCNNIKDKTFYQLIESLAWANHVDK